MQNVRAFSSIIDMAQARARTGTSARSRLWVAALVFSVMIMGGYFRFVGINWDDFTHLHPDERFLTGVVSGLRGGLSLTDEPQEIRASRLQECMERYPETNGVGGYFDARCSNLNPHNTGNGLYVYGTLPLFITRGAAELMNGVSTAWAQLNGDPTYIERVWTDYGAIHLVWRAMSALAEMGVILIAFLIGAKLYDQWVGVLAAFLYAAAAFSIQLAHFGTADAIGNFFCALALLFAVCVQKEGRLINYALFGIALGAALASRINLAPMAVIVIVAAVLRALPAFHANVAWGERERLVTEGLGGLALAGFLTILAFRLFNPYAFNGPGFFGLSLNPRWLEDLDRSRQFVTGAIDFPPNYQWASRTQWLYPLKDMILWGMGLAFGLVGWISFAVAGWRIVRGRPGALGNLLPFLWTLGYFGYMGAQWVMVIRYYIPVYPALAVMAAWALLTLIRSARAENRRAWLWFGRGLLAVTVGFTLLWAVMFTNIYRQQLTRVQASHWVWENVPSDFAMRVNGAPADTPLIQIPIPQCSGSDNLLEKATCFNDVFPRHSISFTAPASGTISEVYAPHLVDPVSDADPETLRITIRPADQPDAILTELTVERNFPAGDHVLGDAYTFELDQPLDVVAGWDYVFEAELMAGDALVSGGSVFSWEGAWDDPVPMKVCELPSGITLADNPPSGLVADPRLCNGLDPWWGLVNGHELNVVYEDTQEKRDNLIRYLNESDYIAISSNRFYDSMARNPQRWPMTMVYYEALFDGRLGYDLVAQFDETFEFGPLRVSDQHLPTYDSPAWLNEFESDEAFSVYDHPAVFIFQRRADYDAAAVAAVLNTVPLNRITEGPLLLGCPGVETYYCDTTLINVNPQGTSEVDAAPTQLRFTDDMWQIQTEGGTWSERFNPESPLNTQMSIGIVGWWLTIMLFGFAAFPLLFVAFPGLADRGYAVSKFVGMFLVGWGTWFLASARIPAWNQAGIAVGLIVLFAFGLFLVIRTRAPLLAFVRAHWRRLAALELITTALFGAFILVRLTNPDLWHPSYGGEKPMDFAYFNGVLRSTIFPPIDPWNAGGYINYYYFGFVIVGTPVLLLQIMPSIAYNLILPTLFAATGIGAFSVAFSAVNAWRERRTESTESAAAHEDNADPAPPERRQRIGSMWIAGAAALVLAIVLGNLDTPRVVLTGIARMGGYLQMERGLEGYLIDQFVVQYQRQPTEYELLDIFNRADTNALPDRIQYEITHAGNVITSLGRGFGALLSGQPLSISAERWFWAPSRIYAETTGVEGNAITEMPYFTFIYGDLHAHMISMPLQLFTMLFILHEVITAGAERRRVRWLAILLGGLAAGMLRATNTWDWITYMVFGVVGLGFVWFMRVRLFQWQFASRRALIDMVGAVGGFILVSFAGAAPYLTWFVTTYSRVLPWEEGKAPIWAYLTIHGLFLFLLVSLLAWDTVRWLRSIQVRALRGTFAGLVVGLLVAASVLVLAAILSLLEYPITILVVPLLLWIAVLFFRKDQTLSMQFVLATAGLALALTLAVEYVVLDGDIGRQNTVFKFYLQAWLLFSVVGGVAAAVLLRAVDRWRPSARAGWLTAFAALVIIAAMFPIMSTSGKSVFRFFREQPLTLDGMAYMRFATQYEGAPTLQAIDPQRTTFSLANDYMLIRWMQDNLQGSPVIVEGLSEPSEYKWNGRIAINTGLPAVIGWNWHQRQQRTLPNMGRQVEMRVANVNAFYQTTDIDYALRFLQFYNVEYIVVGDLERAYYMPSGLAKFRTLLNQGILETVFDQNGTTLYHVVGELDAVVSTDAPVSESLTMQFMAQ